MAPNKTTIKAFYTFRNKGRQVQCSRQQYYKWIFVLEVTLQHCCESILVDVATIAILSCIYACVCCLWIFFLFNSLRLFPFAAAKHIKNKINSCFQFHAWKSLLMRFAYDLQKYRNYSLRNIFDKVTIKKHMTTNSLP